MAPVSAGRPLTQVYSAAGPSRPCGQPDLGGARSLTTGLAVAFFGLAVLFLAWLLLRRRYADGHGVGAENPGRRGWWASQFGPGTAAILVVLGLASLVAHFVVDAGAYRDDPPSPRPSVTAGASPRAVGNLEVDSYSVKPGGRLALCGGAAAHLARGVIADDRAVGQPKTDQIFLIDQVHGNKYYAQGRIQVDAGGRWSLPIYINHENCYYRRPVALMVVDADGGTAAQLSAHIAPHDRRKPFGRLGWRVLGYVYVLKLPQGWRPFPCWSPA